ncbi:oligosaccharide flippase family protein [Litorisediminicola beolgyonensis]|uniref:Oligosaccharide flippase family protein n=1 Tax=Litorisediminicola beolgyonensis TaxID=1173614 RepID=A0ABW3ZJ25_9RHOB
MRGTSLLSSALAGLGAQQGSGIAMTLVAAALMAPEVFGTFALAAAFVEIGVLLTHSGLWHFLATADGADESDEACLEATLFWALLALGNAGGLVLALAAPLLARVFDAPELAWLLPVLALAQPFVALSGWAGAVLTRHGRLGTYYGGLAHANLVAVAIGLTALVAWPGVLALAVWRVSRALLTAWTLMRVVRRGPLRRPSWHVFREALRYARPLYGARMAEHGAGFGADIALALIFSTAETGLWRIAQRLAQVGPEIMAQAVRMSALSRLGEAIRNGRGAALRFADAAAATVFLAGGAAITVAMFGEALVEALFGPAYAAAALALPALSLRAAALPLAGLVEPVAAASGRTGLYFWMAVGESVAMLICCVLFAASGGAVLAWAQACVACLAGAFGLWLCARQVRARAADLSVTLSGAALWLGLYALGAGVLRDVLLVQGLAVSLGATLLWAVCVTAMAGLSGTLALFSDAGERAQTAEAAGKPA